MKPTEPPWKWMVVTGGGWWGWGWGRAIAGADTALASATAAAARSRIFMTTAPGCCWKPGRWHRLRLPRAWNLEERDRDTGVVKLAMASARTASVDLPAALLVHPGHEVAHDLGRRRVVGGDDGADAVVGGGDVGFELLRADVSEVGLVLERGAHDDHHRRRRGRP